MIVGPSYSLATRKAAVQRAVNYMLRAVEPGNEKSGFYLQQVPGLTHFATLGQEIRGAVQVGQRLFVVSGSLLYEVASDGVGTVLGTLTSSSGPVDMTEGVVQMVMVDGDYGYVLDLATNAFQAITDPAFYGSPRVCYLDTFYVFIRPDSQQFYISRGDDATTFDATQVEAATSGPDDLVACVVTQRELWMAGEKTIDVYFNAGSAGMPFQRVQGATIEVGCLAAHTLQTVDNSVMWLGRDKNGVGMVWRAQGYQPEIISTQAVSEALRESTDIENARAYTYQQDKQTFYCINAPGLSTTWVYEVSVGQWHERAEHSQGELSPHRALVHVFAHGRNLVGDAGGKLYYFDPSVNTNDGDTLYRERTSPHDAAPSRNRVFFDRLRLDVEVGQTGQNTTPSMELQWSNDGGYTWSNWLARSLGAVGQYSQPVEWRRLGQSRDRVWRLRCTSDCRASIINAAVEAREGAV